jgi:hypothetical protein
MPSDQGWNGDLTTTALDQLDQLDRLDQLDSQDRVRVAAQAVQRLAELGVGLADVRQSLVDRIAELPIEATWLGFERPLADLDGLALQLDALYTELLAVLGAGDQW